MFSGESKDCNFDVWLYEVKCLLEEDNYSADTVKQAVRKSLKGEPAKIAVRLGPSASVEELIDKLQGIYGTVELGESLLAQFYSATQKPGECVATWGCRIEDLLEKARNRGQIKAEVMPEMLRTRFWTGLTQAYKNVSGHLFATSDNFDQLRVDMRRLEAEYSLLDQKAKTKFTCSGINENKMAKNSSEESEISQVKSILCKLSSKVDKLEKTQSQVSSSSHQSGQATGYSSPQQRSRYPNMYRQYNVPNASGQRFSQYPNSRTRVGQGRGNSYRYSETGEPICGRCGQTGHLQYGCRVRLDHLKPNLNGNQPPLGTKR